MDFVGIYYRPSEEPMKNFHKWSRFTAIFGLLILLAATGNGAPVDVRLIAAVKNGNEKAVRDLIAERVNVNAAEVDGSTALHWAAQRDNAELVNLLLSSGANPKTATRYNVTPLYLACVNGNAEIIERLIRAGADANTISEEGETALMTGFRDRAKSTRYKHCSLTAQM
jgi:ankyrin repeat protein